jgi:hypothetical protein
VIGKCYPRHRADHSSSWLNQVERFFALLTECQLRRGIHRSVAALKAVIVVYNAPAKA